MKRVFGKTRLSIALMFLCTTVSMHVYADNVSEHPSSSLIARTPSTFAELLPKDKSATIEVDYWLMGKEGEHGSIDKFEHWSIKREGKTIVFHHERRGYWLHYAMPDYDRIRYVISADGKLMAYDRYQWDRKETRTTEQAEIKGDSCIMTTTTIGFAPKTRLLPLSEFEADLVKNCQPLKLAYHIRMGSRGFTESYQSPFPSLEPPDIRYEFAGSETESIDGAETQVYKLNITQLFKNRGKETHIEKTGHCDVLKSGEIRRLTMFNLYLRPYSFERTTRDHVAKTPYGKHRIEALQKGSDAPLPEMPKMPVGWKLANAYQGWYQKFKEKEVILRGVFESEYYGKPGVAYQVPPYNYFFRTKDGRYGMENFNRYGGEHAEFEIKGKLVTDRHKSTYLIVGWFKPAPKGPSVPQSLEMAPLVEESAK